MADTVVVCCKWPNGMLLRLFDKQKVRYPVLGGGVTEIEESRPRPGAVVVVNGPAVPFGQRPKSNIEGGYALTFNVDAKFFAEWVEQNKDTDYVRNRIIFAMTKEIDAVGEARKLEKVKTGIEPIDPDAPPGEFGRRQRRGDGTGIGAITPETNAAV